MKLTASARKEVKAVRVFVNGKPTLDVPVHTRKKALSLEVPLFAGANRITAIAYDAEGFTSNPKYVDVISNRADLPKSNLYIFAVGISRYPGLPAAWQLSYAHTDATALIEAFKRQTGKLFSRVYHKLLTNDEATVEAIAEGLEGLQAVGANDVAIVFLAGHGIRASKGAFYLLTPAATLQDPARGGLHWGLLGEHLAKIPGRVLLLLDACHAGDLITETMVPNSELAQHLMAEGRSGAMVFGASKGWQYALESQDLGGGFGTFAYGVVQALGAQAKEADLNGNGFVEVMELVDYVRQLVEMETKGEQTPWLVRRELFGDFPIAQVK